MTPRKRGHDLIIFGNDPIFKGSWRLQAHVRTSTHLQFAGPLGNTKGCDSLLVFHGHGELLEFSAPGLPLDGLGQTSLARNEARL